MRKVFVLFLVASLIGIVSISGVGAGPAKFCCECKDLLQTPEYICTMIDKSLYPPNDPVNCVAYCYSNSYFEASSVHYNKKCCSDGRCHECCVMWGDCPSGQVCCDYACYTGNCCTDADCPPENPICDEHECVPEASTLVLFATGLLSLAGYVGLKRRKTK